MGFTELYKNNSKFLNFPGFSMGFQSILEQWIKLKKVL